MAKPPSPPARTSPSPAAASAPRRRGRRGRAGAPLASAGTAPGPTGVVTCSVASCRAGSQREPLLGMSLSLTAHLPRSERDGELLGSSGRAHGDGAGWGGAGGNLYVGCVSGPLPTSRGQDVD